ncbi:MAG: SUMF1/EgtB/PvdO family nonheme iron enzyme [bacterium]|nr:SUMF1/EgtB/PvdO family nonheme iron enzyme [bacterium]
MTEELNEAVLARRASSLLDSFFTGKETRLRHTVLAEAFHGFQHNPGDLIETDGAAKDFAVHCVSRLCEFGCCDGHRHSLAHLLDVIRGNHLGANPHPDYFELPRQLNGPCALPTRAEEWKYLDGLEKGIQRKAVLYSPLSGVARVRPRAGVGPLGGAWDDLAPLKHLQRQCHDEAAPESREFSDILTAFGPGQVRRAALLGKPGSGKSTTLRKLAMDLISRAKADADAPIPVLVSLGDWTEVQDLDAFLADSRRVPEIGETLTALACDHRLVLLLDGLNEIPTGQRENKTTQVRKYLQALDDDAPVYVTCRSDDYPALDLGLDTLSLEPLAPPRVREVLHHWLQLEYRAEGEERAERLFWHLAGDPALAGVLDAWLKAGADEVLFWSVEEIPRDNPDVYSSTSIPEDKLWERHVRDPRSLIHLAANPFMLTMLFRVWLFEQETLPRNRGELFTRFVDTLLDREHLASLDPVTGEPRYTEDGRLLLDGLADLAWTMQTRRIEAGGAVGGDAGVLTVVRRDEVVVTLGGEALVKKAEDATFLEGGEELRFRHQLLQEYFTALAMRLQLQQGKLDTRQLWSVEHWWERSGWEESTLLLAGLYAEDCTPVIRWLKDDQPERAAACISESGADVSQREVLLMELHHAWLPRLTDIEREPEPEARAAIGRALGLLGLDDREGVGLNHNGLPEIDWVEIPPGEFVYQESEKRRLGTFRIARYPVTNAQFKAFIRDGGYEDRRWWKGLHERIEAPQAPRWSYPNHPRESVSWYEAMAFCNWLGAKLDLDIRLPTEEEWERAARGTDGREYPWGDGYQTGYANIDEVWGNAGPHQLQQTSSVGIYPQARSSEGVLDLAGNVWEWCLSEYNRAGRKSNKGKGSRVLRGGSWHDYRVSARADYRVGYDPFDRFDDLGFRVVCGSPIR